MSTSGVLDCQVVQGTVDGNVFYDFVQSRVLPHLMPFNGINPHSVLVLDNASIHHVDGIVRMVESVGGLVLFLPQYSPDFNPIEELFSKLKSNIKCYEDELEMQEMDLDEIVLAAFSRITVSLTECNAMHTTSKLRWLFIERHIASLIREEKTKMCYRELTATIIELMQVHHTMSRDRESRAEQISYNTQHITLHYRQ